MQTQMILTCKCAIESQQRQTASTDLLTTVLLQIRKKKKKGWLFRVMVKVAVQWDMDPR